MNMKASTLVKHLDFKSNSLPKKIAKQTNNTKQNKTEF